MLAEPLILRDRQSTFTLTILAALDSFVRMKDGKRANQLLLTLILILATRSPTLAQTPNTTPAQGNEPQFQRFSDLHHPIKIEMDNDRHFRDTIVSRQGLSSGFRIELPVHESAFDTS
jgi:hypothetical protein